MTIEGLKLTSNPGLLLRTQATIHRLVSSANDFLEP